MSGGHYEVGRQLYVLGRYDQARQAFEKELEHDPDDVFARGMYALCVMQSDRDRALELALALVSDAPAHHYSHYTLALVHGRRKEPSEACGAIREAIAIWPSNAEHLRVLAHELTELNDWTEALVYAERAIELAPMDPSVLVLLGAIHANLGDLARAKAAWEAALRSDPECETAHANLGWLRVKQEDARGALPHYYEALRVDPTSEFARTGLRDALVGSHWVARWIQPFRRASVGLRLVLWCLVMAAFAYAMDAGVVSLIIAVSIAALFLLPAILPDEVSTSILETSLVFHRRLRAAEPEAHRQRVRRIVLALVGGVASAIVLLTSTGFIGAPLLGAIAVWLLAYCTAERAHETLARKIRKSVIVGGVIGILLGAIAVLRHDEELATGILFAGVIALCVAFLVTMFTKRPAL